MDGSVELVRFADILEKAVDEVLEHGIVTDDLLPRTVSSAKKTVDFQEFISEVSKRVRYNVVVLSG